MSTTPHSQSTLSYSSLTNAYPGLLPVTITRQALFQFNLSIYQQLTKLEKQFARQPQPMAFFTRKGWQPPIRKPR